MSGTAANQFWETIFRSTAALPPDPQKLTPQAQPQAQQHVATDGILISAWALGFPATW